LIGGQLRDEINAAIALSNDDTRNGRPKILSVLVEDCKSAMWPLLLGRLYFRFDGRYEAALNEFVERGLGLGVSSFSSKGYRFRIFSGVFRCPDSDICSSEIFS